MNDPKKTTLAAAVVGGYLLGRTRKGKLALLLASIIAGRKLPLNPQDLIAQGLRRAVETPQFRELTEQVRNELLQSGRAAARAAADRAMSSYADTLRQRTEELRRRGGGGKQEPQEREEPEREEGEEPEREEPGRGEREEPERKEAEGKEAEDKEPEPEESGREEAGEESGRRPRREERKPPGDRRDSSDREAAKKPSPRTGHRR
ncbi:MAG TPA: hypothetical protein VE546_17500 [Streptomyces sp.]|uniref:hypothetical protein n=1 Tax=Streptomyces sp. TaxID=1931 RepID=UPI002D41CDC3|nr:hypothetical protein [Streptomyces sp.]HZG05338.1 hypothetical protein [Streptomyces sp.]